MKKKGSEEVQSEGYKSYPEQHLIVGTSIWTLELLLLFTVTQKE